MTGSGHASAKRVLRESLLAARSALSAQDRASHDAAIVARAEALAGGAALVAGYAPLPDEPGGPALPQRLARILPPRGLLLPAMRPDRDLDWVAYTGQLAAGTVLRAVREPPGTRLGVAALSRAEIVFVPALAVDASGTRLGRGGGSYDRALARVPAGVPIVALLYPGELVAVVPRQAHDRPVTAVITPEGLVEIG
jgi:5-formyltetrahydrofolate cyclo-ligase